MQNANENGYGTIEEFVERDRSKQIEMEEMLRDCKLEEIMSPISFIQNVNAWIVGW